MFDATDLEIARCEHAYEMGEDTLSDRSWSVFYDIAKTEIIRRGWCSTFTSGKPRGLDETDDEFGFSIDSAYDAWEAGWTVAQFITKVRHARYVLGLES